MRVHTQTYKWLFSVKMESIIPLFPCSFCRQQNPAKREGGSEGGVFVWSLWLKEAEGMQGRQPHSSDCVCVWCYGQREWKKKTEKKKGKRVMEKLRLQRGQIRRCACVFKRKRAIKMHLLVDAMSEDMSNHYSRGWSQTKQTHRMKETSARVMIQAHRHVLLSVISR